MPCSWCPRGTQHSLRALDNTNSSDLLPKTQQAHFFPINLNFSAQCKPAVSHLHHHSRSTDKWMISVHLHLKKKKNN